MLKTFCLHPQFASPFLCTERNYKSFSCANENVFAARSERKVSFLFIYLIFLMFLHKPLKAHGRRLRKKVCGAIVLVALC